MTSTKDQENTAEINETIEKTSNLKLDNEFTEQPSEDANPELATFDPTLKKKKKKPKQKDVVSNPSESNLLNNENLTEGSVTNDNNEDSNNLDEFSLLSKKKKKKPKKKVNFKATSDSLDDPVYSGEDIKRQDNGQPTPITEQEDAGLDTNELIENMGNTQNDGSKELSYGELLDRFYQILELNNPDLFGDKKKHAIPPPIVSKDGNKKTIFENINQICERIKRNMDHVIQFILVELGTSGSIDGMQRLVIKGRFLPKQIENLIRKYIFEYVTCKTCKTLNTQLKKENRIFFIHCLMCGSQRSVGAIKSGFKAVLKKDKPVA